MGSRAGRPLWACVRGFSLVLMLALAGPLQARPERGARLDHPARIVSMNPCIDNVLVRVADPAQVAAISHWSHEAKGTSLPLALAMRFPAHGGTAEEVIAARPDLVLLTPYTPLATRAALARLGIKTISVGMPASIEDSLQQVRTIAQAAGQEARGERMVAEISAALEKSRRTAAPAPALMRMASGLVPGPGSLSEALMAHAGLRSVAADYGLKGAGVLPLEPLALKPPALLITDRPGAMPPIVAKLRVRVEAFDRSLLNCGGPSLAPAAERLAEIRDAVK